MALKGNGWTVR